LGRHTLVLLLPLFLHRVAVAAAEKADAVGVLEIVNGVRIAAELANVRLNGPPILLAAKDQLLLPLPLCLDQSRREHAHQPHGDHGEKHRQDQQHVAALGALAASGCGARKSRMIHAIIHDSNSVRGTPLW
jgi:hypothetical protein